MNISIKKRIYWSFFLLVSLFLLNGIVTNITLNHNRKLTQRITQIVDPSLQVLDDFKKMMLESKMYITSWVFLGSNLEDKGLLKKLHDSDYHLLKSKLYDYSSHWVNKNWIDSLNRVFTGFEELIIIEKSIMTSLKKPGDYEDPFAKLESERKTEEEILPRTNELVNALHAIHSFGSGIRMEEIARLENASMKLRKFILISGITIIIAGFILSIYMTKIIIGPVNRIRHIINNLGQGIIQKIDQPVNKDEIGRMIQSVNNLSEKLHTTATFAHEVGIRNFDMPFKPLSEGDTLGKALVAMRNKLRSSDQELIDAKMEIQTIFDAALDAVVIIDEDGRIVKWDYKAETLFGWKEEEVMGKSLGEIIIPFRYREAHQKGMKHFLKTGEGAILGKTVEVQALKKNKDEFEISLSVSPSLIKDKYRFIGFIRDISVRKKAEAELRRSEESYRQIVETAEEGIWMIDENNHTSFVNKRLCKIFGYEACEMIGKELYYFMDEEGKKIASASIERRRQGISDAFDFKFITKQGKVIWTHLSNSSVLDDKGKYLGALAMVTDITQRKLDEESLQKSEMNLALKNKELEQKNKELEQFAYVASHDLQEPLRTTSGFVELLQHQYKGTLDDRADKYLTYISQATARMKSFITDLLEFSRIGSQKELKQVDCNIVLSNVLADLDTSIGETGAKITSGPLPIVGGYQTEIKQLFQNLIFNSIKFRKKGISPLLTISASEKTGYWQFAFTDNGIGIAKEHNERIFIIFQRLHTRSEYNGSGIGLSHCKKIVELHKGKIWLESELGRGTTFYFTLPQNN